MALEIFVRKVLDAALEHNPKEACVRVDFNSTTAHPLATRFVAALQSRGYEMVSTKARDRAYGAGRPVGLASLVNMTLIAVSPKVLVNAAVNDQARAKLVECLCDTFHQEKVVLGRHRTTPNRGGG